MKISVDCDPVKLVEIQQAKDKSDKTWAEVICIGLNVPYESAKMGRPSAGDVEERYKQFLADCREEHLAKMRQQLRDSNRKMMKELGMDVEE